MLEANLLYIANPRTARYHHHHSRYSKHPIQNLDVGRSGMLFETATGQTCSNTCFAGKRSSTWHPPRRRPSLLPSLCFPLNPALLVPQKASRGVKILILECMSRTLTPDKTFSLHFVNKAGGSYCTTSHWHRSSGNPRRGQT